MTEQELARNTSHQLKEYFNVDVTPGRILQTLRRTPRDEQADLTQFVLYTCVEYAAELADMDRPIAALRVLDELDRAHDRIVYKYERDRERFLRGASAKIESRQPEISPAELEEVMSRFLSRLNVEELLFAHAILAGNTVSQAAEQMGVSRATAYRYRQNMLEAIERFHAEQ